MSPVKLSRPFTKLPRMNREISEQLSAEGLLCYFIIAIFLIWVYGPSLAVGYLYHDDYLISQVTNTRSCRHHPQALYYLIDVFRPGALVIKCALGFLSPTIEQLVFLKYVSLALCFVTLALFFNELRKLVPSQFWALALTLFLGALPSFQQPILNLANTTHLIAWLLGFFSGVIFLNCWDANRFSVGKILPLFLTLLLLYSATATYPMSSFAFFIPVCVQILRSNSFFKIAEIASLSGGMIAVVFSLYLGTKNLAFSFFSHLLANPTKLNITLDFSSLINFYLEKAPSWFLAVNNYQPLEPHFVERLGWVFSVLVLSFIAMSFTKSKPLKTAAVRLTKVVVICAILTFCLFPVAATGYFLLFRLFIVFHAILIIFTTFLLAKIVADTGILYQKIPKWPFVTRGVSALNTLATLSACIFLLIFGANWQRSILNEVAIPNLLEYQEVFTAVNNQLRHQESIHVITKQRPDRAKSADEFSLLTSHFPQDVDLIVNRAFISGQKPRPPSLLVTNGPTANLATWPKTKKIDQRAVLLIDLSD